MSSERLSTIQQIVDRADHAYYNTGHAILEDAVYDALKDELQALNPGDERMRRVGAPVPAESILARVRHTIPMGSQFKVVSRAEFDRWVAGLGASQPVQLHANLKADGCSISLEYVSGSLFRAVTRGSGDEGEDITANALRFKGVPTAGVRHRGEMFSGFVRAEVVLNVSDWKIAEPDQATNPRNVCSGIARRKDGLQSELLTVIAFRAHHPSGDELCGTEGELEQALSEMGFAVARSVRGGADDVWSFFEMIHEERDSLPFWIDGIVCKLDDVAEQRAQGTVDNRPKGQVAIKFPAKGATSTLRRVELSVGHTGAIIPTAKFDPIQVGGTTVTSALLCNWDEIRALDVAIGDEVMVVKRGDIIPKIEAVTCRRADRVTIDEPHCCPACGGAIERRETLAGEQSAALYCGNAHCSAKISGKLRRFLDSLNIRGVGDEVLNALIAIGVTDAADLYRLKHRGEELAALTLSSGVRLGRKRADKIIEEIDGRRALSLTEFIGALGVDGLAQGRVKQVRELAPGQMDALEDWLGDKLISLAVQVALPGVAPQFVAEIQRNRTLVDRLLASGVVVKSDEPVVSAAADAPSVCFTGAMSKPRAELAALAKAKGWIVKDDVSKGLSFLVMADPNSSSGKAVKARKLGTQCLGEDDFLSRVM